MYQLGVACTSFHLNMRHVGEMYDKEPIVWHEEILDEYWDRIETEIDRRKQLGMVSDICAIQIGNDASMGQRRRCISCHLSEQKRH